MKRWMFFTTTLFACLASFLRPVQAHRRAHPGAWFLSQTLRPRCEPFLYAPYPYPRRGYYPALRGPYYVPPPGRVYYERVYPDNPAYFYGRPPEIHIFMDSIDGDLF